MPSFVKIVDHKWLKKLTKSRLLAFFVVLVAVWGLLHCGLGNPGPNINFRLKNFLPSPEAVSLLMEQEEMRESVMGDSQEEELDESHFLRRSTTYLVGEAEKETDGSVSDSVGVGSADSIER